MHIVQSAVVTVMHHRYGVAYRAMTVYICDMINEPATIPGPRLAEQRRGYGVTREALAKKLGVHRNTLRAWETAHSLDVLRQRRYVTALRDLIGGDAA
jgi:DNA-binding XRE family transcriptional regulator